MIVAVITSTIPVPVNFIHKWFFLQINPQNADIISIS